ncbi:hypothetical protein P7C73_g1487, partial [Tremellales sp. Uapishka_1]
MADLPPVPPPLSPQIRLLVSLSALCTSLHPTPALPSPNAITSTWLKSVLKLLDISAAQLPTSISPENVQASSRDQIVDWSEAEQLRIAGILVEASLAVAAFDKKDAEKEREGLKYSPISKSLSHQTLALLGLDAGNLLPVAEKNLSETLFHALQAAKGAKKEDEVENTRKAHSEGWGGSLGRTLATGAGVIAGGVLIGVTGGLAAPAIAALLAPLGIGGLLSASAAPVVLGTLFGVGGGGLAGRRVRERWRGVEEFGFVEVGNGTKASVEEMEDLKKSKYEIRKKKEDEVKEKERVEAEKEKSAGEKRPVDGPNMYGDEKGNLKSADEEDGADDEDNDQTVEQQVENERHALEERLLDLSIGGGDQSPTKARAENSPRNSLDSSKEDKSILQVDKAPSLTATIVVPGLLTVSRTEAITAWRAICSASKTTTTPRLIPFLKGKQTTTDHPNPSGLKDGRDVYLLRFESEAMLKTGRDVDFWVSSKLKGYIKKQIIKRTLLSAYFAAVSLPLSVYSIATMSLDNTWMKAQDRAKKAGRILGEVLEKRVQGERPVVLIGSSLGALTVLQALLYLSTLPPSPSVPNFVESAFLISLPSAPTAEEWSKCRSVVARRLVNAWSDSDLVLAGVVRLHEVVSRAAVMSNGIRVAGLGPVEKVGVQDVDISTVLKGHFELQTKMGDILDVLRIDD